MCLVQVCTANPQHSTWYEGKCRVRSLCRQMVKGAARVLGDFFSHVTPVLGCGRICSDMVTVCSRGPIIEASPPPSLQPSHGLTGRTAGGRPPRAFLGKAARWPLGAESSAVTRPPCLLISVLLLKHTVTAMTLRSRPLHSPRALVSPLPLGRRRDNSVRLPPASQLSGQGAL